MKAGGESRPKPGEGEAIPADRFAGERAEKYDEGIRRAIPGYEALHDMAHALLRPHLGDGARLLIVGSGSGTEMVGMGEQEPGWSFTGVDPSPSMTAVARRRLESSGLANRADLHLGHVRDLPASRPYDAATALLVMHFVPDDGQKLALLRSISERLRPGAPLVLADLHGDETSARFSRFLAAWKLRQVALGMEEADVEEMFREMLEVVHFVPEERIVALLREAGFHEVERYFNAMLFGGWVAHRVPRGAARK